MKRVPPSSRTREEIRHALRGEPDHTDPRNRLVRLGIQAMIEEALEAKVRDLLGRDYYERIDGEVSGYRNGYRRGRLKTSEGSVTYASPQVRDTDGSSLAALRELLSGKTEVLEDLAVEMFARGLSTRDIEATFRGEDGRSLLSRTAVSEITERLWEEYEEFATRDLSEIKPLYLFLDGLAERLRPGAKREAILCAWCITWEGKKILIHLAPGTKESTECCREFLEEMKRRGLTDALLVATDGAAGLIRAVEECLPTALRQRCQAHKMRNIASKLPEEIRVEFEQAARAAYQAPSLPMARTLRDDLVKRFEKDCPSAVRCFLEDFNACVAHLHVPPAHRRMTRTTNLLERLFGEERRRLKAAPSLFGERAVLKMMYGAVIRATENWRGVRITDFERRQLKRLQEQLTKRSTEEHQPAARPASTPKRISSRRRT